MIFNNVVLTSETIESTKQWFINNAKACIAEAVSGEVFVNDLESYIDSQNRRIKDFEANLNQNNFTFMQRAYFHQTGHDVALLHL